MFFKNKDYKKIFFIIIILSVISILILYKTSRHTLSNNDISKGNHEEISAWIVDWQWEPGIKDFEEIGNKLSSLQIFAAYFNQHDNLYFTEKLNKVLPEFMGLKNESKLNNLYITIVNDKFTGEGKVIQKDAELLKRLMATEESRNQHIDEIIKLMEENNFDGVEIDYENIDENIWENYIKFCSSLYKRLKNIDKSLRIVLEPNSPLNKAALPSGPCYVMMAYNLYGYHSEPGPKANNKFIRDLALKMEKIPGEKIMAFATGGFDWSEDGKVVSLTEVEAAKLSDKSLDEVKRDDSSGSLYFSYFDDNNTKHTVWYADYKTFDQWFNISKQIGYKKFALWRLGDVQKKTLEYLKNNINY